MFGAPNVFLSEQDIADIREALTLAEDDLRYRVNDLHEDYTDEDRASMIEFADRLNRLYYRVAS